MTASRETGELSVATETATPPPDTPPSDALPSEIGGYRLVRLLGSGLRATTALVHAEGTTRVARVFRASCPPAAIDAELAVHDAIGAADAALRDHTVVADDLATLPGDRLALLLDQVAGPRLDDLLTARRGTLTLGEAVTLLTPIVQALEAAHAVGLTGLGLSAHGVRLSAGGAPVIVRLQDALAGPALPERFRALEPAYADDLAALERLGAAVAAAVRERDRRGLLTALRTPALSGGLVTALFDVAAPEPVRIAAEATIDEPRPTSPVDASRRGGDEPRAADDRERVRRREPESRQRAEATESGGVEGRLPTWLEAVVDSARALGLPAGVVEPAQAAAERLVAVADRLVSAVDRRMRPPTRGAGADQRPRPLRTGPTVRPRFVVAGAVGAVALVVALVLVAAPPVAVDAATPGVDSSAGTEPADAQSDAHSDSERDPAHDLDVGATDDGDGADRDAPESALHPQADEWHGIVSTLVDRWSACRASPDRDDAGAECARHVAHEGSAAARLLNLDDERHAVLERWSALGGEAVVVERMGGAVLVDLVAAGTTTASLLVVRSEAGWRIRDVIG